MSLASIWPQPAPNSSTAIAARAERGQLPRWGILLMAPARAAVAYLVAGGFLVGGRANPLSPVATWWVVWGTLIDLVCLAALAALARREGIRLRDLAGVSRRHLWSDLQQAPLLLLAYVPALVIISVIQHGFYGATPYPPQVALVRLPRWAAFYSIIVWPVIWAFAEDVTYLGYLLPRLEVVTRSRAWPVVIVVVLWSIQHPALPLLSGRYLLYRALSAVPITLTFTLLFRWRRRLLPVMVAHWAADLLSALTVGFLQ
jgi:membrane protease YdiL (CAAX protease family)